MQIIQGSCITLGKINNNFKERRSIKHSTYYQVSNAKNIYTEDHVYTKVIFDSTKVVGDFSLANNSLIKVLSSFREETTCNIQTKISTFFQDKKLWTNGIRILQKHYSTE